MNRYIVGILAALLLALLALVWYQGRQAGIEKMNRENETLHYQQRVSEIQLRLSQERATLLRERRENRRMDSLYNVAIKAQKSKTKAQEKKAVELRPQIDQLADSITVLGDYLAVNDSIQAGKDATIVKLEQRADSLQASHQLEVKLLEDQVTKLLQDAAADQEQIADLNEKITKAESKSRKRFSFGISGGYSVVEHSGQVLAGPGITAGIGYRLFSW